jgi:DNA-binding NarL/FixJ family response regulator
MRAAISVLVLSHDQMFADALGAVLTAEADFRLIPGAMEADLDAALARADVVLLDVAHDRAAAMQAVAAIRRRWESARVLIVRLAGEDERALDFIQAGAVGYVRQDVSPAELVAAIQALHAGEVCCPPRLAAAALARLAALGGDTRADEPVACPGLSDREAEVLRLLADGLSNKEIGRALKIRLPTVKNHVHHVLAKLGVSRRRDAARRAYEIGLLSETDGPWTSRGPRLGARRGTTSDG